jgi:citrate synthase
MKVYLTSAEAASQLGVSIATLYAYVSRGFIRSIKIDGNPRRARAYMAEDIYRLVSSREMRQRGGRTAEQRTDALESRITLIENEQLYYGGHRAIELARTHTLEQVARILWNSEKAGMTEMVDADSALLHRIVERVSASAEPMLPIYKALTGLTVAANGNGQFWMRDKTSTIGTGMFALQVMVSCITGVVADGQPMHVQLARAWGAGDKSTAELLRMALVLCADHELDPSTYAVRCIASTGTNLLLALAGGLAAMTGPRHGGAVATARALIRECKREPKAGDYLIARLQSGEHFPSFGHALYRSGDPRAACLLAALKERRPAHASVAVIHEIIATIWQGVATAPNLDFALAALEEVLELPPSSALSIFALGRGVGWVAHAREQAMTNSTPIRHRALYIGPRPPAAGTANAPAPEH